MQSIFIIIYVKYTERGVLQNAYCNIYCAYILLFIYSYSQKYCLQYCPWKIIDENAFLIMIRVLKFNYVLDIIWACINSNDHIQDCTNYLSCIFVYWRISLNRNFYFVMRVIELFFNILCYKDTSLLIISIMYRIAQTNSDIFQTIYGNYSNCTYFKMHYAYSKLFI